MIEEPPESDAFAAQLASLKPAIASIDARDVFYRAGFAAGRASLQTTLRKQLTFAVAASVLLTGLSATILYRFSAIVHSGRPTLVQSNFPGSIPSDKPTPSLIPNVTTIQIATSAEIPTPSSSAAATLGAQEQVMPWWMQLVQSIHRTPIATTSGDSFSSFYRLGLSTDDWSRLAEIPRPVAPSSDDIEFVPALDDPPLSPRDSLRLRSSALFPWL